MTHSVVLLQLHSLIWAAASHFSNMSVSAFLQALLSNREAVKDTIRPALAQGNNSYSPCNSNEWTAGSLSLKHPESTPNSALSLHVDSLATVVHETVPTAGWTDNHSEHAHNRKDTTVLPHTSRSWPMNLEEISVKKYEEMKVILNSVI